MSLHLPLQVRRHLPSNPHWGSACWEICQIPGLYVRKQDGAWRAESLLQQRSQAYRVWSMLSNQHFPTRRDILQAIQMACQLQVDRSGA